MTAASGSSLEGKREYPLTYRHGGQNAIDQVRGGVGHAPPCAARAEAAELTGEGDEKIVTARIAVRAHEAVSEDTAAEIVAKLGFNVARERCAVALARMGEERLEVLAHERVEDRLRRAVRSIRGRECGHAVRRKRVACPPGDSTFSTSWAVSHWLGPDRASRAGQRRGRQARRRARSGVSSSSRQRSRRRPRPRRRSGSCCVLDDVRVYAAQVVASVTRKDPSTEALAEPLLRPISTWPTRRGGAASPVDGAPSPTPDVAPAESPPSPRKRRSIQPGAPRRSAKCESSDERATRTSAKTRSIDRNAAPRSAKARSIQSCAALALPTAGSIHPARALTSGRSLHRGVRERLTSRPRGSCTNPRHLALTCRPPTAHPTLMREGLGRFGFMRRHRGRAACAR